MYTQKGIAHILILVILALGLGALLYLTQKTQIFKPRAYESNSGSQITILTNQLLEAKERYDSVTSADGRQPNTDTLVRLARERKDKLLEEAENNPQAFLDHATLYSQRDSFPAEVQKLIEEEKTVQGEVTVIHQDDFENHRSITSYLLDAEDQTYDLHFARGAAQLLTGSVVSASGVNLESSLVLAIGDPAGNTSLSTISAATLPSAIGEQRTAVIVINDPSLPPRQIDRIKNAFFGSTNSVNQFYIQNSFGQTWFSGDVFGPYKLSQSTNSCEIGKWADEADAIATQAGVNLGIYTHKVYLIPFGNCPPAGGWGTIGGKPSRAWLFSENLHPASHELGHNLGVHHSNVLTCGNQAIDSYENCTVWEYVDITVMSTWSFAQFNAPHKIAFGWIPQSNVQTITQDGRYRISPPIQLQSTGEISQVIRIRKADTNEYYYLSYRQQLLMDSNIGERFARGTNFHVWDDIPATPTKALIASPQVRLDPVTPGVSLGDNETFRDQRNGIEVRQISHDASSVTLEVKFLPVPSPTPTPISTPTTIPTSTPQPTVAPSPSPTPTATTPCTITSASWRASSPVIEGTSVGGFAQAAGNCAGKIAHFTVFEAGFRLGPFPPNQPRDIAFIGEGERWTASTDWIAQLIPTRTNKYYFRVDIVKQKNSTFSVPELLEVVRQL